MTSVLRGRDTLRGADGFRVLRGVSELHVEAGPYLEGALPEGGLVGELLLYFARGPIGNTGRGLFGLPALESLADKPARRIVDVRSVGSGLRVVARFWRRADERSRPAARRGRSPSPGGMSRSDRRVVQ